MSNYFLYGANSVSLRQITQDLTNLLGYKFQERDSSHKGGTYFLANACSSNEISVEENWEDEEGYASESAHRDYSVLVYLNRAEGSVPAALSSMPVLVHLRTEEVP